MVAIGVPDVQALHRVLDKLKRHAIPHYAWHEPDFDFGLTAICTAPIAGAARRVLSNYRLWSSTGQCVREHLAPLKREETGSSPVWPANASVAQPSEHSMTNREDAGWMPAGSSMPGGGRHSTSLECEPGTNFHIEM